MILYLIFPVPILKLSVISWKIKLSVFISFAEFLPHVEDDEEFSEDILGRLNKSLLDRLLAEKYQIPQHILNAIQPLTDNDSHYFIHT